MPEPGNGIPVTMVLYSFLTGGSESVAATLATHFHSTGMRVSAVATHSGRGTTSEKLEAAGIPCLALGEDAGGRLRRSIRLFDHLRRTRCKILHVHHFNMLATCYWPARLAGVRRIVVTEHSIHLMQDDRRSLQAARKYGPKADLITVVHQGMREFIGQALGTLASDIEVIPNGVDTTVFSPGNGRTNLEQLSAVDPGDGVVVGCIGRLYKEKDHLNLLRAVSQLRDRGESGFIVFIVGDGDERDSLDQFVCDHGLEEVVQFLGERHDVAELLREMDIFVLPSSTEGHPVALLEAMSSGLPCVATAVGGVPGVLADGGGIVVPAQDPAALADGLSSLIRDPGARARLGLEARKTILSRFNIRTMLARYERALSGS